MVIFCNNSLDIVLDYSIVHELVLILYFVLDLVLITLLVGELF